MPIDVDEEMCEADKRSQWVSGSDPKIPLGCSDNDFLKFNIQISNLLQS